ncbi:hypothetical protein ABN764_24720 [Paenibacillaceae sp. P-4]
MSAGLPYGLLPFSGEAERQRIDPKGRSCIRGSEPGMERVMTIT